MDGEPLVTGRGLHRRVASLAAQRYRAGGHWTYRFAQFKLSSDPFYSVLLTQGLVPAGARVLDLGCGQGLLAAWLFAARQSYSNGDWDGACPAPVSIESYRGIDRNEAEVRRARQALAGMGEFVAGDIASQDLSGGTLFVLLDVLHYLDHSAQLQLLRQVRAALPTHGALLLRVGDSDGSVRARISGAVDRLVMRLRGRSDTQLWRRPLQEWQELLEEVGFAVEHVARQSSVGHVNCLLRAIPAPR